MSDKVLQMIKSKQEWTFFQAWLDFQRRLLWSQEGCLWEWEVWTKRQSVKIVQKTNNDGGNMGQSNSITYSPDSPDIDSEGNMSQTIWPWSGGPDTIEKQWKVVRPWHGAEQQHRLLVPPKHCQRLHPLPSRRLGRRRGGIVLFYQWPARRWTLFDV